MDIEKTPQRLRIRLPRRFSYWLGLWRETILAEQEGLTVGGRLAPWEEVDDLRLVPRVAEMAQNLQAMAQMAGQLGMKLPAGTERSLGWAQRYGGRLGPGSLQFRQGKSLRRFGFGLSDEEARQVLELLLPWQPLRPISPLGMLGGMWR